MIKPFSGEFQEGPTDKFSAVPERSGAAPNLHLLCCRHWSVFIDFLEEFLFRQEGDAQLGGLLAFGRPHGLARQYERSFLGDASGRLAAVSFDDFLIVFARILRESAADNDSLPLSFPHTAQSHPRCCRPSPK